MNKLLLVLSLTVTTLVGAAPVTTILLEDAKLELTKGKGSIVLKAGSVLEVVSAEGDSIAVIFRSLQGRILVNKTDYKSGGAKPIPEKSQPKADAPPAQPRPPAAKPAVSSPAAVASPASAMPTSMPGKMVKKARDNEARHKENLVEPTNAAATAAEK